MRSTRYLLTALVLALAVAGCATAETTPSATVTTLMPGSERFFRIDWEATPDRGDTRRLRGYVENTYGEAAARVQLLGQALDTSGALVGQRLSWVQGAIPGFGRVYYEIPGMPVAENYRVTVWAFERIQGRDGGFVIR
ncbi:MAG TPA: hypothetical protein VIE36_13955 [Methylomirabilota bacterium]|jgi:hypothetical protein